MSMAKPINRNSRAYVEEQRARREAAVEAARIEAETKNATAAQTIAAEALEKLGKVVRGGVADAAYVGALRLALHAGGLLRDKVDVNSKNVTRVEVVHADDAPGALRKIDGDDDGE